MGVSVCYKFTCVFIICYVCVMCTRCVMCGFRSCMVVRRAQRLCRVPVCRSACSLAAVCCLLPLSSQPAAAALLLLLSGGIFFFSSTVRTACLYSCTVYRFLLGYWLPIISNWDHTSTINAAPYSNVIAYVLRITVSSCRRSCIHFSR